MTREVRVASVHDLPEGGMKEVEVDEHKILLVFLKGRYIALGGACPHHGASLAEGLLHDGRIRCPWHQAVFSAESGDLEEPPALDSLPRFEVRVEGEDVFVVLPDPVPASRPQPMSKADTRADTRTFVIVGAGAAGLTAAETLRQEGYQGRLILVTREPHLPYDRTDLSKPYLRKPDAGKPFLRDETFFAAYGIEVQRGREVTEVRTREKTIEYRDGEAQRYDRLLLATGSRARALGLPGEGLQNVLTLRGLEDAEKLRERIGQSKSAVLVGASFIAMEVAAALAERNVAVTVVAPEAVPFQAVFGEQIGDMYRRLHEEKGVRFRLGSTVSRFVGDDAVKSVTLESQEALSSDLVVVGVGVKPDTDYVHGLETAEDGSLRADNRMRVSEDVFAAGDMVQFPDWRTGAPIRIEHWRVAQQQGRVAARNMAGKQTEYRDAPFFWTNQYFVITDYIGYAPAWDDLLFDGDPEARRFVAYYLEKDRVLAAAVCGEERKMCMLGAILSRPEPPRLDDVRSMLARV